MILWFGKIGNEKSILKYVFLGCWICLISLKLLSMVSIEESLPPSLGSLFFNLVVLFKWGFLLSFKVTKIKSLMSYEYKTLYFFNKLIIKYFSSKSNIKKLAYFMIKPTCHIFIKTECDTQWFKTE